MKVADTRDMLTASAHLHVEEALGVAPAEDHDPLLVAVHADLAEQPPEHRLGLLL